MKFSTLLVLFSLASECAGQIKIPLGHGPSIFSKNTNKKKVIMSKIRQMSNQLVHDDFWTSFASVDPTPDTDLINYNNRQYIGYAYFGDPQQLTDVMFDTGSSKVWAYDHTNCVNCPEGDRFYESDISKSYLQDTVNDTPLTIEYEIGSITGHLVYDDFCFNLDNKVKSCLETPIKFMAVNKA